MRDDDLPLHPDYEPDEGGQRRAWLWVAAALVLVAAVAAAVFFWGRAEPEAPPAATEGVRPGEAAPGDVSLGPEVAPIDLPPLDETDAIVRELVGALSSRPEVASWLATDDLIRNFVTALENVSEGKTPSRHLKVLAPKEPFRVVESGDRAYVDPRSYQRYNGLAQAADALDAEGVARLYSMLKPRLADAYRELGHPEGNVDAAVEKAIAHLLDAPSGGQRIELTEGVVSYRFADPRLENATAAQKQLIRMGPENQALIQAKLREIAAALGMESESRAPLP